MNAADKILSDGDILDMLRILVEYSGVWQPGLTSLNRLVNLHLIAPKPTNNGNHYPSDYELTEDTYMFLEAIRYAFIAKAVMNNG